MAGIPFVDAHVHLWDLSHIHYPWLSPPFADDGPNGSVEPIARNYLLDDYLADASRWDVRGIVHIDAGADPVDGLAETAWLESLAATRGMPNAIVAFAPLADPDVEPLLERHAAHPHVRGIRQIVNWHVDPRRTYTTRDLTQDDRWRAGFALLGKYGLSFDLQCYADQMAGLAQLMAKHPDTPVIINHVGMPVITDIEGVARWRKGLAALAALPQVAIKLSGLGFIDRAWRVPQVRSFLLEAIDLFGTDRCLIASDAPTDKLFAPFDTSLNAYRAIVADFSEDEQRALWGRNANRVYRLGLDL